LNKITDGKIESIELPRNKGNTVNQLIYEDQNGNFLIGTDRGLFQFKDGQLVPLLLDNTQACNVTSVVEDQSGTLWFGTYGGLQRYKDGKFTLFNNKDGLQDDVILSLLEDDYNNLWISGDKGFSRINKKEIEDYSLGRIKSIPSLFIEREEGSGISKLIQQYEQPVGFPSAWKGHDGSLWFTSFTGLVKIDPTRVKFNQEIPPVHIENILIDRKPIEIKEYIEISPGKRDFEFHYIGLSFIESNKVSYKYKLEGFDKEWVDAGSRRIAYYNQLQPGEYKFRVIASNNDGLWNETGTTITFHLQPYFYQTNLFYLLCAISTIGLSFVAYRIRIRQLQRSRDAALEASRLKSEFLSTMSHELRTPLNGVIGMSNLLIDTSLNSEQVEFAETIKTSSEALLSIINDILDYTRLEADKISFNSQPFDLYECVEEVAELLSIGAQTKGLLLDTIVYSDVPTLLHGDRGRIRQILLNLVGNAIKFTDKGHVIVRVSKINETPTETTIRCEISDTGIGISQANQDNLFEAFTQVDSSATRKYGGTGLGLAISKQLIHHLGGEIGVSSKKGQGATFWFTARFDKQKTAFAPAKEELRDRSILIISKNGYIRDNLQHQAINWGMRETCASSIKEGIERLEAQILSKAPFELIVLSIEDQSDWNELATYRSTLIKSRAKLIVISSNKKNIAHKYLNEIEAEIILTPFKRDYLFDTFCKLTNKEMFPVPTIVELTSSSLPNTNGRHTSTEPSANGNNAQARILLAEDNMVNQKVAIRMLQKLGYSADVVENGKEVLNAIAERDYDIILMDCMMPEMDGYEATQEIRKREGDRRHTKIIAMTANALVGDREKCLEAGMDDYLSKPVKQADLNTMLVKWIEAACKEAYETIM
jgi:signal transduction histidine kinase/CheY-like chemotaxis protein